MIGKLGVYILLFTLRKLGILKSNNPLLTVALCTLLPIPRLGVMALVHLGFDALLISAFLAGVKRTTGLTPALGQVPNKDVRQLLRQYLEFGEYVFDFAVVFFGRSSSFERKR
ncbi:hypothetical protein VKT23_002465 [Stygiomarasmius scandens]|uniref:DUF4149 domain-containing protein n=1 Tax=Marasmiellus scandens TaxID=2682957 RepID=A0ABR1K5Q2_9AGAR